MIVVSEPSAAKAVAVKEKSIIFPLTPACRKVSEPTFSESEELGYGSVTFTLQEEEIQSQCEVYSSLHAKTLVNYIFPLNSVLYASDVGKHKSDEAYGKYYAVRAYTTFYYDRKTVNNVRSKWKGLAIQYTVASPFCCRIATIEMESFSI